MQYTLIKQINPQHAHISFEGLFEGKKVIWDTQFLTIQEFVKIENSAINGKQIIDIQSAEANILKLTVALNIPKISEPEIRKMIIMIRQYKNLALGRHQYG